MPFETVRDFVSAHHNYIDELDTRTEHLAAELGLSVRHREERLREYARELGIWVVEVPRESLDSARRHYDPVSATLYLAEEETSARKAFQLACQIALTAQGDVIERIVARADGPGGMRDDVISRLIRIGLANYAAGALLLPYGTFLDAAQETRWDLDLLRATFDVGLETVCHRISTLQRPGQRGIPFALIRVDRAGNISKRQSAAPFHFS